MSAALTSAYLSTKTTSTLLMPAFFAVYFTYWAIVSGSAYPASFTVIEQSLSWGYIILRDMFSTFLDFSDMSKQTAKRKALSGFSTLPFLSFMMRQGKRKSLARY